MESALSFASDLIEAIPEAMCIYLATTDLMVPNERWKREAGDMTRLADLGRLSVNVREVASLLTRRPSQPIPDQDCTVAPDPLGARRLLITEIPGNPYVFSLMLRNETEVRRVEQLRKDFIANVSHELRTPLTAVRGYVETLMDPKFLTMERVQEFLPVIFEHSERLHNLMLDLLSLSRLENPNTHIELSPLPLADQIADAVEATAPLARMKNVQVNMSPPAEHILALSSSQHMERILVNLLDNAIKYSKPGGIVNVWTRQEGNFIWTHVQDEGQGIAPEELPRVFERFYRTKGALSGRERGSGLGLAIVKHIVQQLGGEIGVTSSPGRGSDFYFSIRLTRNGGGGGNGGETGHAANGITKHAPTTPPPRLYQSRPHHPATAAKFSFLGAPTSSSAL